MNQGELTFSLNLAKKIVRSVGAISASAFVCATGAQTLFLNPGTVNLQPNLAGQSIEFYVNNTGGVQPIGAVDFSIRIGDSTSGPTITSLNIIAGTPFAGNNTGQNADPANTSRQQFWSTEAANLSSPPTLAAGDNLLATVIFDTTGLSGGSWNLTFDFPGLTQYADTGGNPIAIDITNGTLTAVPEPAEYAAMAALGCLAWAVYSRKTKAIRTA